jgi:hypothetical protein
MTLTPSQIEVLARFDGWEYKPASKLWSKYTEGYVTLYMSIEMVDYLTSPGVLIEMRFKLVETQASKQQLYFYRDMDDLGRLILNKKYTEAANLLAEIINKIEGQ